MQSLLELRFLSVLLCLCLARCQRCFDCDLFCSALSQQLAWPCRSKLRHSAPMLRCGCLRVSAVIVWLLCVARSARVRQFDASHMEYLRETASELVPRVDAGGQTAVCALLCTCFPLWFPSCPCSSYSVQAGSCASNSIGHSVRSGSAHAARDVYDWHVPCCFLSGRTLSRCL